MAPKKPEKPTTAPPMASLNFHPLPPAPPGLTEEKLSGCTRLHYHKSLVVLPPNATVVQRTTFTWLASDSKAPQQLQRRCISGTPIGAPTGYQMWIPVAGRRINGITESHYLTERTLCSRQVISLEPDHQRDS